MRIETARNIVRAGRNQGVHLDIRDEYSGRGMMGERTAAIEFENYGRLMLCIAEAAREADNYDYEMLIGDLNGLRFDTIGMNMLVY